VALSHCAVVSAKSFYLLAREQQKGKASKKTAEKGTRLLSLIGRGAERRAKHKRGD